MSCSDENAGRTRPGLLAGVLVLAGLGAAIAWWWPPVPGIAADGAGTTFAITMPAATRTLYREVRDRRDERLREWVAVELAIGDGEPMPARLHARGQNSLKSARKSFKVDLGERRGVLPGIELRRLLLLNLRFDQHGFEMAFCFDILADFDLFPSRHRFVRVAINGEDEGLYLLVERPRDAFRRVHPDTTAVLRTNAVGFQLVWKQPDVDPQALRRRLAAACEADDPAERARRLDACVDLTGVMRWMAFNTLVQNADTVDEAFLHGRRVDGQAVGRLAVAGWDYDDLQAPPARPDRVHEDPLSWSSETGIEKAVLLTAALRERYRETLFDLLQQSLTPAFLRDRLRAVRERLDLVDPAGRRARSAAMAAFETALIRRRAELLRIAGA